MTYNVLAINPNFVTPCNMASDLFEDFKERINRLDKKAVRSNAPAFLHAQSGNDGDRFELSEVQDFIKTPEGTAALLLGGVIAPIRRNQSVFKKIEEGNEEGAAVQVGVSLLNLPSDITQLAYAYREIKNIYANGGPKGLPKRVYQREMPFIKGSPVEGLARKYKWIENADKTLFDTKIGKSIQNIFKVQYNSETDVVKTKGVLQSQGLQAVKTPGNCLQKIVNRTLLRTSLLGATTTSLLELPAIIKSVTKTEGTVFDKAKALGVQLIKSGAYVGLITAGVSIGGAVLFPYGVVAELVGMATGSAIAMTASDFINKQVDKIFNKY